MTRKITEYDAQAALYRMLGRQQKYLIPGVFFAGCECDMLVVTKAGLMWEIEVKVTLADWRNDQHKRKWRVDQIPDARDRQWWQNERKKISRFYYAVPRELVKKACFLVQCC